MKTIRASEISTYLYCQRAWWYQKSGYESGNLAAMSAGENVHQRHGRSVAAVGYLRKLAALLLLVSLAIFTFYLISLVL